MTTRSPKISLLLADHHRLMREGLKHILSIADDMAVVAEADDGHKALEQVRHGHVDVAIIDVGLPGMTGIELIRRLAVDHKNVGLLILTSHAETEYAVRAFRAGANGYLTKDAAPDELFVAVRKVAAGGVHITPAMAELLAQQLRGQDNGAPHTLLSNREFEVFRLIVSGLRNAEIAERLTLSVKTISTHKAHVLEKLRLESAAALIKYSLAHQLFDDAQPSGQSPMRRAADRRPQPAER